MLGMDRKDHVDVQGIQVSPRDLLSAALPDPATLGSRMKGKTCAGALATGPTKKVSLRRCYMYNVIDNEWSMAEYGDQLLFGRQPINPVIAMELIHKGIWKPEGCWTGMV
jgi:saccharopine dehydrogenase-like NADP-dependent oxidoreductase